MPFTTAGGGLESGYQYECLRLRVAGDVHGDHQQDRQSLENAHQLHQRSSQTALVSLLS